MATVRVTFVDAASGQPFARSEMPAGQLPESFAAQTTLQLGEDQWIVERAEPETRAEATARGRMVLTLRRVEMMAPQDILYSLPTLCAELPPLADQPAGADALVLHEDDWRQVELASRANAAAVDGELAAIRRIFAEHRRGAGFDQIHLREIAAISEPLPSWAQVQANLPRPERELGGVRFRDAPNRVAGSFALGYGAGAVCYGIVQRERVTVLGLIGTPPVAGLARALDLVVVDWCGAGRE
ncbi:hypothetical protein ACQP00_28415 [Dactylosporangium sp. CS-047395]|uniref:hypothetical protein n=1 Tax=Dactylosporangium sp. CS-047395 TaxID=3239936 RepID=UPI003D94C99A